MQVLESRVTALVAGLLLPLQDPLIPRIPRLSSRPQAWAFTSLCGERVTLLMVAFSLRLWNKLIPSRNIPNQKVISKTKAKNRMHLKHVFILMVALKVLWASSQFRDHLVFFLLPTLPHLVFRGVPYVAKMGDSFILVINMLVWGYKIAVWESPGISPEYLLTAWSGIFCLTWCFVLFDVASWAIM